MAPAVLALQAGPLPARRAAMAPAGLPTPRGLLGGTWAGARGEHARRRLPSCAATRRYRPYSPGSEPPPNGQWEPPSAKQKEPFDMEVRPAVERGGGRGVAAVQRACAKPCGALVARLLDTRAAATPLPFPSPPCLTASPAALPRS